MKNAGTKPPVLRVALGRLCGEIRGGKLIVTTYAGQPSRRQWTVGPRGRAHKTGMIGQRAAERIGGRRSPVRRLRRAGKSKETTLALVLEESWGRNEVEAGVQAAVGARTAPAARQSGATGDGSTADGRPTGPWAS